MMRKISCTNVYNQYRNLHVHEGQYHETVLSSKISLGIGTSIHCGWYQISQLSQQAIGILSGCLHVQYSSTGNVCTTLCILVVPLRTELGKLVSIWLSKHFSKWGLNCSWLYCTVNGSMLLHSSVAVAMEKMPQSVPPTCCWTLTTLMLTRGRFSDFNIVQAWRTMLLSSLGMVIAESYKSTHPLSQSMFDKHAQCPGSTYIICTKSLGVDFHFFSAWRWWVSCKPFCFGNWILRSLLAAERWFAVRHLPLIKICLSPTDRPSCPIQQSR